MWYLFGLITLCIFILYGILIRSDSSWSGDISSINKKRFTYKFNKKKSGLFSNKFKLVTIFLGIEAQKGYDYTLKTERKLDRFFKFLRLSNEHQIGKTQFDNLVYIASDNPSFLNTLSDHEELSNCIIHVFEAAEKHGVILKELRHRYGKLWVQLKVKNNLKDEEAWRKISADIIPLLHRINALLEELPSKSLNKWKDPFTLKAAIILGLSLGLAFNGVFHLFRLFIWVDIPFIIDVSDLVKDALLYGSIFTLILMLLTIYLLKRSSRTHLVLIELITIGYFGAISTAYYELRDINMGLDKSKATPYKVEVHSKRYSSGRRSSSHFLTLDDWNNTNETKEIEVSSRLYKRTQVNNFVIVNQKQGYLGYKWVESIKANRYTFK